MCGIAGFIGEDKERIDQMTKALIHRGPDGNAVFVGDGVSLGHARLAILDPTPAGDQPMWNESKNVVIVYNGEIFNYRRLKKEFNLQCKTDTDTEVILKLYELHGIGFVTKLIGMFAFALYDIKTRTLHLVRDAYGIKPLYTVMLNGRLRFASEMRALMAGMKTKPKINLSSLSSFLRLQYVPGPATMCEGIESLPPGTIQTCKVEHEGLETEWMEAHTRMKFHPERIATPRLTKTCFKESFPSIMQEVVRDHMISDKPIGIFLSGGMDSSILLHHMVKASTKPVKTFTVRFDTTEEEDSARFNRDADLALLTAKYYRTDHQELLLTAHDYRSMYRDTARALDLPNSDSVSVAQFALARMAKKKVDVVLSGAGGDELFGGYPRYRIARVLQMIDWMPRSLRSLLGQTLGYPSDVLALSPGPELAIRLLALPEKEVEKIIRGGWFETQGIRTLFAKRFAQEKNFNPVRQFMEVDRHMWLVDESLKLADAVTMASGLECRVPFLDPRIIAWSHATPTHWHVGIRRTKALLKDTYRNILPEHLFTLDKASFYPPLAKWIRRECAPLVEEALAGKRINEFFDTETLRMMFDEHKAKTRYNLHPLANVVQLHHWFETVYDA